MDSVTTDQKQEQTTIKETTDYDRFKLIESNRPLLQGHVRQLAQSIAEKPDGLKFRPILVTKRMEVIDGQHRLAAARMLGVPVYYLQSDQADMADAQRLNAVQRNWQPLDYARSYAAHGNQAYSDYLQLREEFPLGHNVLLKAVTSNTRTTNLNLTFRQGRLKFTYTLEQARELLTMLQDIIEHSPEDRGMRNSRVFHSSILSLLKHPDYHHGDFLNKLDQYGERHLRRFSTTGEYGRALESIYNERRPFEDQIKLG